MATKKSLEWLNCSEDELRIRMGGWLEKHDLSNAIIFLNGPMGAGKSTFARTLLKVLAPSQLSKGSPTFPLVHEYRREQPLKGKGTAGSPIYHIDLYRLKNEAELEDSGILSQIEEQGALSMVEWSTSFPATFVHWMKASTPRTKNVWVIEIDPTADPSLRSFKLMQIA